MAEIINLNDWKAKNQELVNGARKEMRLARIQRLLDEAVHELHAAYHYQEINEMMEYNAHLPNGMIFQFKVLEYDPFRKLF